MAIAYDNGVAATFVNPGTSSTVAFSVTGDLIIAGVWTNSNPGTVAVSYGGDALTQIGSSVADGNGNKVHLFRLSSPKTGTNNLVATTTNSTHIALYGQSYSGVDQSSPIDNSSSGSVPVNSPPWQFSATVSSSSDNCWAVLVGRDNAEGNLNAVSGCIERPIVAGSIQAFDTNAPKTPSGGITMTLVSTGSRAYTGTYIIAALKPASAAASPTSSLMMMGCGT